MTGIPVPGDLIIIGASARAAAFSAALAGYRPYWIDQFGDRDLASAFPGSRVDPAAYPGGIVDLVRDAPQAPWLYTGALENHRQVLGQVAALRPLLGNGPEICAAVRDPWRLHACLEAAGLPRPELARIESSPAGSDWILKPLHSGGGIGIRQWSATAAVAADHYLQRRIRGESYSAVYVGDGRNAALLGVSRQLVGLEEFYASPFSYCGSIGPLEISAGERGQWMAIGTALAAEFGLRGLFGVDALRSRSAIVTVEVNPRYTASVEVIESGLGLQTVAMHVTGCAGTLPPSGDGEISRYQGKCYLFAPRAMQIDPARFPDLRGAEGAPRFSDVPQPGSTVQSGAPVTTLRVSAGNAEACATLLSRYAARFYAALART